MAGEELKSYRKKQWWVSGCGCGDGGGVRGVRTGGVAAGVFVSQGQVDPPHAHLLLTPPSSTLILTQTCHVRVLVFVIRAAPLVTSPTEGRRQRAAQGKSEEEAAPRPEDWGE